MRELENAYRDAAVTPGGVSWLDVHHVPARRLLTQIVRHVLSTRHDDERPPPTSRGGTTALRGSWFTDTTGETGLGYGRPPRQRPQLARYDHRPPPRTSNRALVTAISWRRPHAETLLPVLDDLARRGITSSVIDLAGDTHHRFPVPSHPAIAIIRPPDVIPQGGLPVGSLHAIRDERTVRVGFHDLPVSGVADLMARTITRSSSVSRPSWATAVAVERWLDNVFGTVRPKAFLCADDTNPPGLLATRCAERAGAETVYVQPGAWVEGEVAWRAQHCKHIAVMGPRDLERCSGWQRHHRETRQYVTGQPRFDGLAGVDRRAQREYLEALFTVQTGAVPRRVLVWGAQPHPEGRLLAHFRVLLDSLRQIGPGWGLVIAPHPAQRLAAMRPLLRFVGGEHVVLAGPHVGARGCVAGADAFVTGYSNSALEALLLNVPVLELVPPGDPTLALAHHGAAQRCAGSDGVAAALRHIERMPVGSHVPTTVKDEICRWTGDSARTVADLVIRVLAPEKESPCS
ncbi:hypothetical protein ACWGIB_23615 [Streptomyces xiamenensis]